MTLEDTINILRYILDLEQPIHEHGGFHPQTIEVAKFALHYIDYWKRRAEAAIKDRDELMEMIKIIPCTCHEGFKSRNLTDPVCPRCNWIDEDLVNRLVNKVKP